MPLCFSCSILKRMFSASSSIRLYTVNGSSRRSSYPNHSAKRRLLSRIAPVSGSHRTIASGACSMTARYRASLSTIVSSALRRVIAIATCAAMMESTSLSFGAKRWMSSSRYRVSTPKTFPWESCKGAPMHSKAGALYRSISPVSLNWLYSADVKCTTRPACMKYSVNPFPTGRALGIKLTSSAP